MGMKPMLAETADPDEIGRYVSDKDWWMQPKADGQRYLVTIEDDASVLVLNRAGVPKTSNLSWAILAEVEKLAKQVQGNGTWVLAGEYVEGDKLLLFDMPAAGSHLDAKAPFGERLTVLEQLHRLWQPDPAKIVLLPIARTEAEKLNMLHEAEVQHREGVMLRHVGGTYRPATRSGHLLKHKFVKEIDAIVVRLRDKGKDNAVLALLDPVRGVVE